MIQPSRLPRHVLFASLAELMRRQQRFADAVLAPDLGGAPPGKAKNRPGWHPARLSNHCNSFASGPAKVIAPVSRVNPRCASSDAGGDGHAAVR
jgi:hypothetical protein